MEMHLIAYLQTLFSKNRIKCVKLVILFLKKMKFIFLVVFLFARFGDSALVVVSCSVDGSEEFLEAVDCQSLLHGCHFQYVTISGRNVKLVDSLSHSDIHNSIELCL